MGKENITLQYIDTIHKSLFQSGKTGNRNLIISSITSIVLIGLSKEILMVGEKISIWGANLQIQSWFIILSLTWLLAITYIRILGLSINEKRLRSKIVKLYEDISFSDESMKDIESNPLEYPNILTTLTSGNILKLGKFEFFVSVIALMIMLLPFVAEVYAYFKLYTEFGLEWWLIVSLVFVIGIMLIYTVAFIHSIDRKFKDKNNSSASVDSNSAVVERE